jgi:hypothetical protein
VPWPKKQFEAFCAVFECEGNVSEAARRLGRDRKTVKQHYDAALAKLGAAAPKHKTVKLPTDRRGQSAVADGQDQRPL